MDGNLSPQQSLEGQAPHSSNSSSPAAQKRTSPLQQLPASLPDSISERSPFAVTSSHSEHFPFENPPSGYNDNIFGLSWSPNSKDSSTSPAPNESRTQFGETPSKSTPTNKRKRQATPPNPPPPPTTNPSTSTPATKEQSFQKRQKRTKATKPKSTSRSKSVENEAPATETLDSATNEMGSERPRLSEQEKKNNHIASEQKRRLAIREGFDRLTEIVPGLEGQGRSESVVLKKSVDHMRDVLHERQQLVERIQALGGEVPPELR
ncbi:hypothetical protein EDC01DRAFT_230690 [Geopyxis carbonaria]|nr:hypothetical protein EDC01DRAFT_230690 [Geopyxis carbonaria]